MNMANVLNLDNGGEKFNICLETNGTLNFKPNSHNCGGIAAVSINDETSNVGIGTTNPRAKLEVAGNGTGGETLALFYNSTYDASILLQAGRSYESYLRFKNTTTGANAWMVGMDDDQQFKITYGNDGEIRNADTKLYVSQSGNVGIGTTSPTEKLHVEGNICCTGTIGGCSDLRYKTDIEPLTDSLNKVLSMHGMRYQWNQEAFPNRGFGEEPQIGFSGQELEVICPEVVSTDLEGYKYIDYSRLTPVLVEAIKEQQQLIEQQESVLREALAKIAQLEFTMQKMSADS